MKSKLFVCLVAAIFTFVSIPTASARDIPWKNSRVKYFYVFGPEGNPLDGKDDSKMNLYIDVPKGTQQEVVLGVYDPDTSAHLDGLIDSANPTTRTQITVSGSNVLEKKTIEPTQHNRNWVWFGPYPASKGKAVGDVHRFTLSVEALSGTDQNLFKVAVEPDHAEVFSDNITFRLLRRDEGKMYFYPEIPSGVTGVTVENFDLDKQGGVSYFVDPSTEQRVKVNDSTSGNWTKTPVSVASGPARRGSYEVETRYQAKGNAGVRVVDAKGNLLPIYFRKGAPAPKAPAPPKPKPQPRAPKPQPKAKLSCNTFTFDARSSYDPNKDPITYLWNFGDGTTSSEPVVQHTYAKAGSYKVSLSVKDASGLECNTGATAQNVDVNLPPNAAFSAPPLSCTGQKVTFNASATKDDTPASLSYNWSFGDGTRAEGQTVSKVFNKGGTYDVVLNVDDNSGTSCATDSITQRVRVNTNPVADAGSDITMYLRNSRDDYRVAFNGTGSSDADRDQLTYSWTFGDGQSGQGAKVEHVYAKPGDYKASLTVNDNSGAPCSTDADDVNIRLNKPPIAEAGEPLAACNGATLTFDGSGSSGESGENLNYQWNFGDGNTASGKVVKHTYAKGGKYSVTLTVDDGRGTPVSQSVDSTSVMVNSTPVAKLDPVGKVCALDGVAFDASGSRDADGDSLKYTWDFGDGTAVESRSKVSHEYKKGGTYNVKVTVDDGKGSPCSISSTSTTVRVNTPPVANTGPNLACCIDQNVTFDGSKSNDPDGDALSYKWSFGDGGSASGARVSHAFKDSGNYNVVLNVNDGSATRCSTDSASFVASVNAKPVPVIKITETR